MSITKEECVIAWNCIKGLGSYPIECTINETQDKFKTIPFVELFSDEIALIDNLINEHFSQPLLAKTAKEMFEELGFNCVNYDFVRLYENKSGMKIKFDFLDRNYTFGVPVELTKEKYWSLIVGNSIHKAIHQQMKEFGWLDE